MSTALDKIPGATPGGSPGPGWDAIAGGDGAQCVWLQVFPGSVELRIQPFPRRFRVMLAECIVIYCSGFVGILVATYLLGEGSAELARYALLLAVLAAISVFLLDPLTRRVRAKKLLGRVQLSDALVHIEIPTAPIGHSRFASMPRDIRRVSVCHPSWYRSAQPFDALFGITRHEVHIERTNGKRFIMSDFDPDAAEVIAAQLEALAGRVVPKRDA